MGPDRPLAITLITPPGRDADRVTVVERFETACGEAAEGAPLQAMALSPTFDIEGYDDGIITRDRDVKDSAADLFRRRISPLRLTGQRRLHLFLPCRRVSPRRRGSSCDQGLDKETPR